MYSVADFIWISFKGDQMSGLAFLATWFRTHLVRINTSFLRKHIKILQFDKDRHIL